MAASRGEVLDGDVVVDILCFEFGDGRSVSRAWEWVSLLGDADATFYIFLFTWESSALIHVPCHAAQRICLVPTAYAHDKPEVATSVGAGFSVWTRMHGKNDESSKVGQLPWM